MPAKTKPKKTVVKTADAMPAEVLTEVSTVPTETANYAAQWDTLRVRERLFFLAWLGGFGMVVWLSSRKDVPGWIGPTLWLAAFLWTGWRWSIFACPRCGERFFKAKNAVFFDQTLRACPHCGLQKYADTDAASKAQEAKSGKN